VSKVKTILLKFSGPLQSWGTSSHFEARHTDFYPSKSAVIGIIAACIGYRRDEDRDIQRLNEINFATRVDWQGNLLMDYQTAHKYKENGEFDRTYVTERYYLEDAVFLVAISHNDDALIGKIEKAFRSPFFQPFMGRRSLPLCADFLMGIMEEGPLEVLENIPWQAPEVYQRRYVRRNQEAYVTLELYADKGLLLDHPADLRKDRVISFSQKNRQFGFRYEARKFVKIPVENGVVETDHDAFAALGE
jgi:CRISPR system Cascade subunit CasD